MAEKEGVAAILFEYQIQFKQNLQTVVIMNKQISIKAKLKIAKGLLEGINFLHETCEIAHLDIKPSNILCSSVDFSVKYIDFGSSRNIGKNSANSNEANLPVCSKLFSAPELFHPIKKIRENLNVKSLDIYAIGKTLLFVERRGYYLNCLISQEIGTKSSYLPPSSSSLSLTDFCNRRLILKDPEQRCSARTALDHLAKLLNS